MNWNQQAQNRVNELIEQINYYVNEGVNKQVAINLVKQETAIGKKYWDIVLEQVS